MQPDTQNQHADEAPVTVASIEAHPDYKGEFFPDDDGGQYVITLGPLDVLFVDDEDGGISMDFGYEGRHLPFFPKTWLQLRALCVALGKPLSQ